MYRQHTRIAESMHLRGCFLQPHPFYNQLTKDFCGLLQKSAIENWHCFDLNRMQFTHIDLNSQMPFQQYDSAIRGVIFFTILFLSYRATGYSWRCPKVEIWVKPNVFSTAVVSATLYPTYSLRWLSEPMVMRVPPSCR